MERQQLISDLRKNVLQCLNIKDITEDAFGPDTPLFGEDGLGLDSVDALEILVMLEKQYSVSIKNGEDPKKIFASLNTLADYVSASVK